MLDVTEKPSIVGTCSWWDFINVQWTYDLILEAGKRKITKDDLGGLKKEDTFQVFSKQVTDIFDSQPKDGKNIIWAVA
jgi:hypothetical protein